jgi:hypothetical protein
MLQYVSIILTKGYLDANKDQAIRNGYWAVGFVDCSCLE